MQDTVFTRADDAPGQARARLVLIALVSLATLGMELFVTKILSFVFWNHVVYLIISIALLGYGASSTFVALAHMRIARYGGAKFITVNLLAFAGSLLSGLALLALAPHYPPFADMADTVGGLLLSYLGLALPFFFAGNVIVYLFTASPTQAGALYGWDLIGAATGCLLFPLLMPVAGAPRAIMLLLFLVCVAAWLWCRQLQDARPRRVLAWTAVTGAALCTATFLFADAWLPFLPSPTKSLGHALYDIYNGPVAREHTAWDTVTRLDVTSGGGPLDIGWKSLPVGVKLITFDGDAISEIHRRDEAFPTPVETRDFAQNNPQMPFFRHATGGQHLVIGLGGGIDIADSLLMGAADIHGVDINGAIIAAMTGPFASYSGGVFTRPNVHLHHAEGRSYLSRSGTTFDVIRMTGVDTFTALNTGAYVLAENYLYTVEAFRDYYRHLSDNGVISVQRWFYDDRPRESLRMFAIILEALRAEGVQHPEEHVAVLRTNAWSLAPTLVRKQPMSATEAKAIRTELQAMAARTRTDIQPIYLPFSDAASHVASPIYHAYAKAFVEGRARLFERDYPFDISPVTDDSPFFFNYYRLSGVLRDWNTTGPIQGYWAYMVFGLILVCASAAVAAFIWLPLLVFRREGLRVPGSARLALYFACLGLGFIAIEIAVMQKFALLLGHPMYSIATVMGGMLVFAGIGSHLSSRIRMNPARCLDFCFAVVLAFCLLLASPPGSEIIEALLGTPFAVRVLVALFMLAPGAIALGFFFPLGLRIAATADERFIPWAWGINSGFTVIGSVIAVVVAMRIGFSWVLLSASAIYLVGLLALRRDDSASSAKALPLSSAG